MHLPPAASLNFDIDKHLSPLIPRNRLNRLPRPISHFLGYRKAPPKPIGNIIVAAWSLLGGFVGILAVSGLFKAAFVQERGGPVVVGSFGAAAILLLSAIDSPFSQPRPALLGQLFASLIGVSITKLFALIPPSASPSTTSFSPANPTDLTILSGALAVALTSSIMVLTKTIHPPAGATALLAATEPAVVKLGWLYVAVMVAGTGIMLAVAAVVNNVQRQFPVFWWAPGGVVPLVKEEKEGEDVDVERQGREGMMGKVACEDGVGEGGVGDAVVGEEGRGDVKYMEDVEDVVVSAGRGIVLPARIHVSDEELGVLRILAERLQELQETNELHKVETAGTYSSTSTLHENSRVER